MQTLFDNFSTGFTSNAFLLENQVTLFATGLPAGGEVRFEIVSFRDTPIETVDISCSTCADTCGPGGFPTSELIVVGTQRVTCGACGTDPNNNQVKLTSASSYIVLDAPMGSYIRAVYIGTGLGTFIVGYSRSNTKDITPAMRGCCPLVADLQVAKTVNPPRGLPNTALTYTVTATNAGPAAADGSILMDTLPAGFAVTSIAVVYAGGAVGPVTLTPAELASFTLTAFPNGATATITIAGQYAQPGYYDNHAVIRVPFGIVDSRLDNNEANAPYTTWHDGSETKVVAGTNMTSVTGTGTIANPYVVNGPLPADGSETKVIAGTNMTSVTGTGTIANPYVVNAPAQVAVTRCDGAGLQPTDRVLVLGDLKKCVAGVVTPLACGDIVRVSTCPEPLIPVPPVDVQLCAAPAFVLGESLDGTIRKYPRYPAKIITPLAGSGSVSSFSTPIGGYALERTLLVENPSSCFTAVALIEYTNSFQIKNRDNLIRDVVEIDRGDGLYLVQVDYLHPYLIGAPAGMTQVHTYDVSRTVFSLVIPAGGSITVRSRMKAAIETVGTVAPTLEAAFAFLNAIVYVDQVL